MKQLVANSCGATAIEYAMIASLVSIIAVTSITAIGTKLSGFFTQVSGNLR